MVDPVSLSEIRGLEAPLRTISELEAAVAGGLPTTALERLFSRRHNDAKTARGFIYEIVPYATWRRRTSRLRAMRASALNG
jgi:uncharacterized protein (DUF2384 family)